MRQLHRTMMSTVAVAALCATGISGAHASDPGPAAPEDHVTVDLGERLRTAATGEILDIPVVDLTTDVGAMSEEPTTFDVTLPPGTYIDGAGAVRSYRSTASWRCQAAAHNPHRSGGAGGVIAKGTVTCTGSSGTLPIQATMLLGKNSRNSTSGMAFVAEETYTQNVFSNMGSTTWYVPALGKPGVSGGAFFRSSIGAASMPPMQNIGIGSNASSIVWVN